MAKNPVDIDAGLAICEKATTAPWHQCCADGTGCGGRMVWRDCGCDRMVDTGMRGDGNWAKNDEQDRHDAAFIACARTGWPAALAELRAKLSEYEVANCTFKHENRELRAQVEGLRELVKCDAAESQIRKAIIPSLEREKRTENHAPRLTPELGLGVGRE